MKNRDRKRAEEAEAAGLESRAAASERASASPPRPEPVTTGARPFLTAMLVWFVVACVAGASGAVARLTPPVPQMMIGALTLGLVLTGALHPALRTWLKRVNLRGFVAFHLTRFVGIVFLVMYSRGELVGEFALTAGWGDIIAATWALLLVALMRNPESKPWLLMLWNAFGLADILTVVITATRIAMSAPADMAPMVRFPMSLVPTFVVPLVIASHVLVFVRLRGQLRQRMEAARRARLV
jgi:hypothetical protein